MAQSAVDACNSALQKVGAASIMNLTDNSREARQCSIAFDSNRRSELRRHRWNFSIKRAVLAPDADAPAFDYGYQFTLPSDCLRVLMPANSDLDWVVEGRKLLTNDGAVLNLRYIADITDVTQWDPAFYDAFCVSLAIDICEALTTSTGKKNALDREYEAVIADARKVNAFEQSPAYGPDDSFITSRY